MRLTVDSAIICAWLDIPAKSWPPDHYTLLGVPATEQDLVTIERQVQQRLEQVRRYQLLHPESATEAMNRIAQAFCCLSNPLARQAYDRCLFGDVPPAPAATVGPSTPTPLPTVLEQPEEALAEVDPEFLALVQEEVRAEETARAAALQTALAPPTPAAAEPPPAAPPVRKPIEPGQKLRGLGTRRALYQQILRTRALRALWDRMGRYVGQPTRRLTRPAEARDLIAVLSAIRQGLDRLPQVIGEAGLPGYLVVTLSRQQSIVPTFQTLHISQREALVRDWTAGRKALQEHQRFLCSEGRLLRHQSRPQRFFRACRSFLHEHPAGWIIVGGFVALAILLVLPLFMR